MSSTETRATGDVVDAIATHGLTPGDLSPARSASLPDTQDGCARKGITSETFDGLAFPVVRVRYAGPTDARGSRYIASCYRDTERSYRASVDYDSARSAGASQAIDAARACFAKALADNNSDASVAEYVAIPGDLSADSYSFTFVPADYLNGGGEC